MISWVKKHWKKSVAFLIALWPALRIFIRWPMVAISIATIPVQQFINSKANLGPVTSKIVGFAIFSMLMIVSWYVAEVIVVLAALALVYEVFLLAKCIMNRYQDQSVRALEVA